MANFTIVHDSSMLYPAPLQTSQEYLSSRPSVDSREVSEGIVLDYDEDDNLVGIDIDHASLKLDIRELILSDLPAEVKQVA